MKSRVSYEKEMRDRAIQDRNGLYTLDLINASKTPGKFGSRITMQGPASAKEYVAIMKFMLKVVKARKSTPVAARGREAAR